MNDLPPRSGVGSGTTSGSWLSNAGPWEQRLAFALETMREMSRVKDPQKMVQDYGARMRKIMHTDGSISLSRRDLSPPQYRITRSSRWGPNVNPWKQKEGQVIFERGLLGELLYGDTAVVLDEISVSRDDPAFEFLDGFGSAAAIPLFDQGIAMNMVVVLRRAPNAFPRESMPEHVWMSNLFGRAAHSLVMAEQVREAYEAVDREMKAVADIQRSLLPERLPEIPTLDLAAHYQTSHRAGGDYFDFFPLTDGQWGFLIADVSGHGTPAAVLMAITHSIAHLCCDPPMPASQLLAAVNARLAASYTADTGNFVTAFYAIYDPADGTLQYANAGHPPPRIRRAATGMIDSIDGVGSLPLGIVHDEPYQNGFARLEPGDTLVLYTDGITEARAPGPAGSHELFGTSRLDEVLQATGASPQQVIAKTLWAIEKFTNRAPANDDRTIVAATVRPTN